MEEINNKMSEMKISKKPRKLKIKDNKINKQCVNNKKLYNIKITNSEIDENNFYKQNFCLNKIPFNMKITNDNYIPDEFKKEQIHSNHYKECVLPKGHVGKCKTNMNNIFKKSKTTDKIISSIDLAIYSTPGNDDYVFKNRSSRLYPYCLTSEQEKKIRDKKIKKKCAIPKKDTSTPRYLAEAYIDWITFIINVHDIKEHIDIDTYMKLGIKDILEKNKQHLIYFYNNRKIFDNDGNSICVITSRKINLVDIADINRDNRINIKDTDIQIGHNIPRSDEYVTIKGCNLLPMSRRGNLIIGDNIFTENKWIDELKNILSYYL